jgi:hypothetical protein
MGQSNRILLSTSLVLFSSMAVFAQVGSAYAQAADEAAAKPAEDTAKAAPAAEEKAAAPATEASAPAAEPVVTAPQPTPEVPPPPPAEWKAQSKGGLLITSGNAQSKNFTFGMNASRKEGNNKLALEGGLAYGTTNALIVRQDSSVDREQIVSTNNWAAKGRYDRFITDNNIAFASGQGAADKIAGKTFFGGGQLGYSRQLVKDQWNIVVAELGYDFSYERYVQPADKVLDPVSIHSARVFVGETLSLTKETGVTASVEALFNLNKEGKAINVKDNTAGVDAFKDTRVNAKVGLTTNLWSSLSFGFSFTLKYDQNPSQRPVPKTAPAGFAFQYGDNLYFADKTDTYTEATLIYTFF